MDGSARLERMVQMTEAPTTDRTYSRVSSQYSTGVSSVNSSVGIL